MLPQLYHAHHNRSLEDLPFWLGLASQLGGPLLELGCGTGRVLIPLAEAGFSTVGVDNDLAMLQFLKLAANPHGMPTPLLIAGDIRRFRLARRFPLIILPCNTFSTLDATERRACLECVRQHLSPGGAFAVSLPNPVLLRSLPARSALRLEDEFCLPQNGNPVQVSSAWRRTRQQFIVTWAYDELFADGTVQRLVVEAGHYLTSVATCLGEIETAGLVVSEIFGDYDRTPFQADAPHLVILASAGNY